MPVPRSRSALIFVLFVIVTGVVTVGLSRLRLDPDVLSTLPRDLPEAGALKLLRDGFAGGDELVIAIEARDETTARDASGSFGRRLRDASALCRSVREGSSFENSDAAGALLAWALENGEPAALTKLRDKLDSADKLKAHLSHVLDVLATSPDPAEVQRWQYDPLGLLEGVEVDRMTALRDAGFSAVSADGCFRLLFVAPKEKLGGYKEATRWLDSLHGIIATWQSSDARFADVTVRFTGEPAFMSEIGNGIENDLGGTVGLDAVLIAALFWFMHRRWKPLLWILGLLGVSIVLSLSLAGLIIGKLTVMSLGFASIVLGIVVDYGVLVLQEAGDHPQLNASQLRRTTMPGILAGAGTTAAVFFALMFIGLPGLSELGLLVGINVVAGAAVMLAFMPYVAARKNLSELHVDEVVRLPVKPHFAIIGTSLLVLGVLFVLLWRGLPPFVGGSEALRPSRSDAAATWDLMQQRLGKAHQASVPLVVRAEEGELRPLVRDVETVLAGAKHDDLLIDSALPAPLITDARNQQANRAAIQWFVNEQDTLRRAVLDAGFTEESLALSDRVAASWRSALTSPAPRNPRQSDAAEVLGRFLADDATAQDIPHSQAVLGVVTLPGEPGSPDTAKLLALKARLSDIHGAQIAAWETLGHSLSERVRKDITREMLPLVVILLVMLTIAYRNALDVLLSVILLALGLAALMATMSALGQSWNLASLAALPLLLGTGIDYGIHMLLGMRAGGNDIRHVRSTTGRAVFFCGATTVIGFISLVIADNRGVASLGLACAAGTIWIMLLVLWLLPHWRCWFAGGSTRQRTPTGDAGSRTSM